MIWAKIASAVMFMGVILGAFGAHALRDKLSPYSLDIYKTAVLYHFIHGLALLFIAWVATQNNDPRLNWAGIFITIGILLFSGSLYILSISGLKWIGAITPLGGLSFLAGWLLLYVSIRTN